MKLLFLRGKVPTDRDPAQIIFNSLSDCDDMWTHLAYGLLLPQDLGEIWYWGATRKNRFASNLQERWINSFQSARYDFGANIIIARGGFPEYDVVMERHIDAKKVYYGAGKRFAPESSYQRYNIILVDSIQQQQIVRKKFPKAQCSVFVKPAAENVFYPVTAEKQYDVIFVPNMYSKRKRCEFFLSGVQDSMRVLVVGDIGKAAIKRPNIHYAGWVPRKKLRELYAASKVAVCPSSGGDSCPRVIPEALACNVPVLVSDDVNIWHDKYIHESASEMSTLKDFFQNLKKMVRDHKLYQPYEYYRKHLSLDVAIRDMRGLIQ